ncbi:PUA domain-containing protein [Halorutilales archaeon Cl-col2-1]
MANLETAKTIADYQFGRKAGDVLFSEDSEFTTSKSGRIRQVKEDGERIATLKNDGKFTLSFEGAQRLHEAFEPPKLRVRFGDESIPYLEDGRNGFAKFVTDVDDEIRARDEVLVTGPDDELVTTGRAELSAVEMRDFDSGVAVLVRS